MTKTEQAAIANIINRLKMPDCGCSHRPLIEAEIADFKSQPEHADVEIVSRIYLDTWIIGALECLLDGPHRDPQLAERLSRK